MAITHGTATLGLGLLTWTTNSWPAFTNDWSAFYPFNVDAREHLGLYDGALENGASITNATRPQQRPDPQRHLQYVLLLTPVANASTFSAWVKWYGGGALQRIFDFGDGTNAYLFLTPAANDRSACALPLPRMVNRRRTHTKHQRPAHQRMVPRRRHAWTGLKGLLYLDGARRHQCQAHDSALAALARSNYVGSSQFPRSYFDGELDSLRIFGRALTAAEIKDWPVRTRRSRTATALRTARGIPSAWPMGFSREPPWSPMAHWC